MTPSPNPGRVHVLSGQVESFSVGSRRFTIKLERLREEFVASNPLGRNHCRGFDHILQTSTCYKRANKSLCAVAGRTHFTSLSEMTPMN